ncbi:MAG TPA: DNA replication complex GINS family protein [Thermoplasmatales archaeon]|nr:DNA replication complex GINS family protein [Thermoplasmatales archaeon]
MEQREKSTSLLLDVGADFYKQTAQYVKELEDRLEEEKVRNPSSKKVVLLSDELRNTKRIWKSIFERREKKIVLSALSFVRGSKETPKNLTREEKIFYDAIIEILKEHRKRVFENHEKEFVVVRIMEDIPQFIGGDMKKYSLKKEDVISLPLDVAKILIKRGVAEEVTAKF